MTAADGLPADVCVLLTPRQIGGHEIALLGWLADAVRRGLRPLIVAPTAALAQACAARGLAPWLHPRWAADAATRPGLLRLLAAWPADRPLLLAPGVLHAHAWLLAAAVALRRLVWVYVPMAYTAVRMNYRFGAWRDRLLAPWLKRVAGWITIDAQQAQCLGNDWQVRSPVYVLPNLARVPGHPPPRPAPAADGRLRVGYVGRFDLQHKGLDWLLAAIHQHPAWRQRLHWRFQGQGPGELALLEMASALGPQHAVVSPHAPLDEALAAVDVLVLPSRYEGLPLVALEATQRGWPVVASRDAGLNALLPASSLFDFGDAAGLAHALDGLRTPAARLLAVSHSRARYGGRGRQQRYASALQALVEALRAR